MMSKIHWILWLCLVAFLVPICTAENVSLETSGGAEDVNLGEASGGEEEQKMRGVLNWAIENSDPEQLRKLAEGIKSGEIENEDDAERRGHIEELIKLMSEQPSEVDLLKEAVLILKDIDASDEEQSRALTAIQILVEPIDNANDLKALDAIGVLVTFLEKGAPFDGQAAHAIGTAASNNPKFQNDIALSNPEAFEQLVKLVSSPEVESASKALYALSALVRNSSDLRALFYTKGGLSAIHKLLADDDIAPPLARKALGLLADMLYMDQIQIQDQDLIRIILSKVHHDDLDIVEKAIRLLLLFQQSKGSSDVIAEMDIGAELWRSKVKMQKLSSEDHDEQYIIDIVGLIDSLLSSVNGTQVPTTDIHEEL